MVICLERDADLHMARLMPLPLTVSCFSKIQIGFTSLVPAHPVSPGKRAVKRVCVCVSIALCPATDCAAHVCCSDGDVVLLLAPLQRLDKLFLGEAEHPCRLQMHLPPQPHASKIPAFHCVHVTHALLMMLLTTINHCLHYRLFNCVTSTQ